MNPKERRTRTILAEVERIHSLIHPLTDRDTERNLSNARSRREDAVRLTVLQLSLATEDVLDGLFARALLGHDPEAKRGARKGKMFRELEDLLEGRMGFEAKLKLARVLRLITKRQFSRLDRLRVLRNKCAHSWMLNVIRKKGRGSKPTKRLLEYEGRNLFDLDVLENFVHTYGKIYVKLFGKYLS